MPRIDIASADDSRLDDYLRLTDVRLRTRIEPERGLFMAESYEVISRALDAGIAPRSFLMSAKWLEKFSPLTDRFPEAPVYVVPESLLEAVTGFPLHRGALAAMHRPPLPDPADLVRDARTVLVIEDVVDHTNVGAVFRSAAALGCDAVLITPRCADPFYRRAVRVSMGTVFQVPWTRVDPWPGRVETLRELGFEVLALALTEDAVALDEVDLGPEKRICFVLGTEGDGLKPRTVAAADRSVIIPMGGGVDSLNVAAAGAVVLWQRRLGLAGRL